MSDNNLRRGDDHPKAKLTNREVELMRQLHEEDSLGYKKLSKIFETHVDTVRDICNYLTRC